MSIFKWDWLDIAKTLYIWNLVNSIDNFIFFLMIQKGDTHTYWETDNHFIKTYLNYVNLSNTGSWQKIWLQYLFMLSIEENKKLNFNFILSNYVLLFFTFLGSCFKNSWRWYNLWLLLVSSHEFKWCFILLVWLRELYFLIIIIIFFTI